MASWKMSIRSKLVLAFFFLISMAVLTTGLSINGLLKTKDGVAQIQSAEQIFSSLVQREMEHVRWALNLQEYLIEQTAQDFSLELDPTKCNLGKWLVGEELGEFLIRFPHLELGFAELHSPHNTLHQSAQDIKELLAMGLTGQAEEVYRLVTEPSLNQIALLLSESRESVREQALKLQANIEQRSARVLRQNLIFLVTATILSALTAFVVTRTITRPLQVLGDAVSKIGAGDLGATWTIRSGDELGSLSDSVATMLAGLRGLVLGIQQMSVEVSALSEDLSGGAVETGAAVHEVASASNQFAGTSVHMAENAAAMQTNTEFAIAELERGLELLRQAIKDVGSARTDVDDLAGTVQGLAAHLQQIRGIVDAITDVSEQTNLLALNAAIEAARAGEEGRGFAVVAEEVRELAEETHAASGEIADLIRQILQETQKTTEGMEMAGRSVDQAEDRINLTGETFAEIGGVFRSVVEQVNEITKAAEDVGQGSEEIAASTQEQSAVINEIAADAEKLAALANRLQEQTTSFYGLN